MTQEEAAALLQKYLDGNATTKEMALVEDWYGNLNAGAELSASRKMQIRAEMLNHIKSATHTDTSKKLFYQVFKVAALILVTLSVGLYFWKSKADPGHSDLLTVSTTSTQKKKVLLRDGTMVMLEPSSSMQYPAGFSATKRQIKLLRGDAFFEVAHEEKRPFSVDLQSGLGINVLGTSFQIWQGEAKKLIRVVVSTGKVSVHQQNKTLAVLTKGDEFLFDKITGVSSVMPSPKPAVVKILFNGHSLKDVIQKLEYVYSIRVQVIDIRMLKLKSTAEFNSKQSPSEILDILCRLHHLQFSSDKAHKNFKIYH